MLRLGRREFGPHEPVIMAIVNRTPDSFYDQGATFDDLPALERVDRAVAEGAAIVDIGGVKAAPATRWTPPRRRAAPSASSPGSASATPMW